MERKRQSVTVAKSFSYHQTLVGSEPALHAKGKIMRPITPELRYSPRRLIIDLRNPEKPTWWEVGIDGERYLTDTDTSVYERIVATGNRSGQGIIKSVRYDYEVLRVVDDEPTLETPKHVENGLEDSGLGEV